MISNRALYLFASAFLGAAMAAFHYGDAAASGVLTALGLIIWLCIF